VNDARLTAEARWRRLQDGDVLELGKPAGQLKRVRIRVRVGER
jgi:hypothetical protein